MEILSEKSDLMFTNLQGLGPLYLAIKGKQIDSIRFLLGRHVAIHSERPEKVENSPLFYAIRQNNQQALEFFCDRNTEQLNYTSDSRGNNTIMYAASYDNFDVVNYLSVRGLNLDVEDREGKTLLLKTLLAEKYELASKLLSRGASINF